LVTTHNPLIFPSSWSMGLSLIPRASRALSSSNSPLGITSIYDEHHESSFCLRQIEKIGFALPPPVRVPKTLAALPNRKLHDHALTRAVTAFVRDHRESVS
jgi:hypothetical protein